MRHPLYEDPDDLYNGDNNGVDIPKGHGSYDHVVCNNCETCMIVEAGEDVCPLCNEDGPLAWADTEQQEFTL